MLFWVTGRGMRDVFRQVDQLSNHLIPQKKITLILLDSASSLI